MSDLKLERNVIRAAKEMVCGMTALNRNIADGRGMGARTFDPGRNHSLAF